MEKYINKLQDDGLLLGNDTGEVADCVNSQAWFKRHTIGVSNSTE